MTPAPPPTFACSICDDPSERICVYCTKDACPNHLCSRCARCSDCCRCEIRLEEPAPPTRRAPPAPVPQGEDLVGAAELEPATDGL
jgi:hypothetical protein